MVKLSPEDKINFLLGLEQHEQRSSAWFEQRKGRLTSSDAGTALGLNPYQKPVELLFKKCGAGEPFKGNVATLHGQKYEDEAIEHYCNAMGKKNYDFGLLDYNAVTDRTHDSHAVTNYPNGVYWMAGSTDGIVIDKRGLEDLVVLEVKCPYRRKIIHGKCPEYYYPQVQLNMAILDIEKADFIEYIPANHLGKKNPMELNIVRIQRDRNWFDTNVPILEAAWKDIELWRTKDIKTHPEYYDFKYHQPPKKTIDIFFYPELETEGSGPGETEGSGPMFLDSDSETD
jgi:putative phage-type endonuclease